MTPEEQIDLRNRIDYGVKLAVAEALLEHKKAGRSIVIAINGELVTIPPDEIEPVFPEEITKDLE